MGLTKQAIRSTSLHGSLNVIRYGGSLILLVIFARMLNPEIFGVVTLATAILTVITLPTRWGTAEVLMQEPNLPAFFSTISWVRLSLGIAVLIVTGIGGLFLNPIYGPDVAFALFVIGTGKAAMVATDQFRGAIQREFRLGVLAGINLLALILSGGVGLWIVSSGNGLAGLISYYALQSIVKAVASITLSPVYPKVEFAFNAADWYFSFAKKMLLSEVLNTGEANGDDILVGTIGGSAILGLYTVAWRLATAFQSISQPTLTNGILPTFSKIRDSDQNSREGIEFILRTQIHISIPGYITVGVVAPELIGLLFGSQWLGATPVLRLLCLLGVLYPLLSTLRQFYYARGNPETVYGVQIVYVPVMLAGIAGLTQIINAVGTAVALDMGVFLGVTLLFRQVREDVKVKFTSFLPAAMAGVIAIVVALLARNNILLSDIPVLLQILSIGLLVSGSFYLVLFAINGRRLRREASIIRQALFG